MSHISIGHLYTALHAACASAVARVVEANGIDVSYIDLGDEERREALENGEVDLLVSAWMPQDEALLSACVEMIGCLYQPELCFSALSASHDSGKAWDTAGFSGFDRLVVTDTARERAGIACARYPALAALSLEVIGEGALWGRVEKAAQSGENPLFIAWQPHAVFHTSHLHVLPDPDTVLGAPLKAQMILRSAFKGQIDGDLLDELSGMMLGNRVMSALDYAVSIEGTDPETAAESWQRGRLLPR